MKIVGTSAESKFYRLEGGQKFFFIIEDSIPEEILNCFSEYRVKIDLVKLIGGMSFY
ncbi:hypothetical protein [Methanosarcina spelaei]|uniref:hypothetical protein n=1 Tax=Methanosarcina spelaei TaxID=1036679 RepID=UPI001482562F|nr:hypothetical protein [Methanosarcina spelaei]